MLLFLEYSVLDFGLMSKAQKSPIYLRNLWKQYKRTLDGFFFFFSFQIGTLDGVDVAKSVIGGLDSNTKFIFIGLAEGSLFH